MVAIVQALLLAFSLSELAFGILVASVFSRAKIAAIVGPLLHFCLLLPRCEPGMLDGDMLSDTTCGLL